MASKNLCWIFKIDANTIRHFFALVFLIVGKLFELIFNSLYCGEIFFLMWIACLQNYLFFWKHTFIQSLSVLLMLSRTLVECVTNYLRLHLVKVNWKEIYESWWEQHSAQYSRTKFYSFWIRPSSFRLDFHPLKLCLNNLWLFTWCVRWFRLIRILKIVRCCSLAS